MGSKIQVSQALAVVRSETVKMNTKTVFIENVHLTDDDDDTFVVLPGDVTLTIPPSTLQSLDGEVLHLKFTGIVEATPLDPRNVQPLYVTCFAESNIDWYWKTGVSQPDNKVEGVATVLFTQYVKYINASDDFVIGVGMDVDVGTKPPAKQVVRPSYGTNY